MQAPDWFPMAHTLSAFYAQRPQLCNVAFDTLLSTLCTLLIFIGLPAMDLILGMDPKDPAQARTPPAITTWTLRMSTCTLEAMDACGRKENSHPHWQAPVIMLRPCCVQGYEGSDLAYKSVLHSHVFLHWLVLLTACMTVGESDMHPLTMLGEAPAPQKAQQHQTFRMLPCQADNKTHMSALTGWIQQQVFHLTFHLPKPGSDCLTGTFQNWQRLQGSQGKEDMGDYCVQACCPAWDAQVPSSSRWPTSCCTAPQRWTRLWPAWA